MKKIPVYKLFKYNYFNNLLKMFLENMTFLTNIVIGLFTFYNNCLTTVKYTFENYYNNNKNFRFLFDITSYFYILFDSYIHDYPVEPLSQHWVNSIIFCIQDNNKNNNQFLEHYETIPYQLEYNDEDVKETLIELLEENKKFNIKTSLDCIENLFIVKYNNKYIFKTNLNNLKANEILDKKNVSNPFFEIKYTNLDTGSYMNIDLPKNYFIDGNEILSNAFMKRFIDYHVALGYFKEEDNLYSNNYSIEITDFCFSALTLDKNSYVLLSGSEFSIQNIK